MTRQNVFIVVIALSLMMCSRPMIGQQGAGASSLRTQQLNSLKELHDNGLLTDEEYQAKLMALRGSGSAGSQGIASEPSYSLAALMAENVAMHSVEIDDPEMGGMRAATLQIPADWRFGGAIVRNGGCHGNGAWVQYSAQSPDGMLAVEVYPSFVWRNTGQVSQPRNISPMIARSFAPPRYPCSPLDMESAAEFLEHVVLPNLRPWAAVTNIGPLGADGQEALRQRLETLRQNSEKQAAQYRQMGWPKGQHPDQHMLDGAMAYIHYSLNGREVEEIVATAVHCAAVWMPGSYVATPSVNVNCNSWPVVVLRAPRGKLAQASTRLMAIKSSIQVDSNWDYRMGQIIQQRGQIINEAIKRQGDALLAAGKAAGDARTAEHNSFMTQQNDKFEQSQGEIRAQEGAMAKQAHDTELYALDERGFIDTKTGTEHDISNRYTNAYLGTDGTVIGSTGPITVTSTVPGISYSPMPTR